MDHLKEIINENYPLYIDGEEELVARVLNAYENEPINTCMKLLQHQIEQPVEYEPLQNLDKCRENIKNSF